MRQLETLLTGVDLDVAKRVCHPEIGLPGKERELSAFTLRRWLDHQAIHARPEPPALPEPEREFCPEAAERMQQIAQAFRSLAKSQDTKWAWPKINGNPIPPHYVLHDGKLRAPIGELAGQRSYFEKG